MSHDAIKRIREERMALAKEMNQLVMTAGEEGRGLTAEEEQQFEKLDTAQREKLQLAERMERASEVEATMAEVRDITARADFHPNPKTVDDSVITRDDWQQAYRGWMASETKLPITERQMAAADKVGFDLVNRQISVRGLFPRAPKSISEVRDMAAEIVTRATTTAQTVTTTGGGHLIDTELASYVEMAMLEYGGMRSVADVIRTDTGGTLNLPTVNDTTNISSVLAINTAADVEALVFGQFQLGAFKYTTKQILVPFELMQDSAFDVVSLVGRAFGERAGRGTNKDFTTGATDGNQPAGAVTESLEGSTGSDVNTLTYAQLVTLQHSVDPAYRRSPSCVWMFNDNTLSVIKKLLDSQNRPLWVGGLGGFGGSEPDTILGIPYIINQDMASIASATTGAGGAKAVLFGDFSKYKIRDVMNLDVLRLNERYAEKAQVGFIGFHRHDGGTVQASTVTVPLKHYITKST